MNQHDLPPELERLQRELVRRPCPEPSADLRDRVMRTVEAELLSTGRRRSEPRRARWGGWPGFATAMAATVLIWINLSLSGANATSYDLRLPTRAHAMDETARQIRQLLPEISEEEVRHHALVLRGSAGLAACPEAALTPPTGRQIDTLDDLLPQGE